MDRNINVGLIGCGIWGKKILRDLLSLGASTTVIDINSDIEADVIKLGATSFSLDIHEPDQYDGIVISTPASTHRLLLEKLSDYQKPVFIEKPLCCSLEDLDWIKQNCSARDIHLMHVWRYHNGIIELGKTAKDKKLGNPIQLVTKRTNWTSPRQDVDSVWTLLPHDLTIAKEVFGYIPQPVSAVSEIYSGIPKGMAGILGKAPSMIFEVSNRYFDKRREVRLHCEGGIAVLQDEITDHIEIYYGGPDSNFDDIETDKIYFDNTPPLKRELGIFIDYLESGEKPKSDLNEGIDVVERILELRELANLE